MNHECSNVAHVLKYSSTQVPKYPSISTRDWVDSRTPFSLLLESILNRVSYVSIK